LSNKEAVASLEKRNKSTSHRKQQRSAKHLGNVNGSTDADSNGIKEGNNWDDDSTPDTEKLFQEEYMMNKNFVDGRSNEYYRKAEITKTRVVSNDSFVVTRRELNGEGKDRVEYFNEGKNGSTFMQRKKITDEEFLFSRRNEESGSYYVSSSATDRLHVEKNKKNILADDSLMVQARPSLIHSFIVTCVASGLIGNTTKALVSFLVFRLVSERTFPFVLRMSSL
jgi:hypothetical protein